MTDRSQSDSTAVVDSAQGQIGPLTFPSLIHDICEEQATGVLTLLDGEREKAVYIEEGRIVFARSNSLDDRLGSLFIRRGLITLRQMEDGSKLSVETGQRFGGCLVSKGFVRPQDLVAGVREQVKEIVVSLFNWTEGCYDMVHGPLPSKELITLRMATSDMILEGVKRIESWSRIKMAVGGLDTVYSVSPRLEELGRSMNLSLEEWTFLSRCEGPVALDRLCGASSMKDFDVCRLVWAFSVVGMLKRHD